MKALALLFWVGPAVVLSACTANGGDAEEPGGAEADLTAATCVAQPACDGAGGPDVGPTRPWEHTLSTFVRHVGAANHRGRDQVIVEDAPQWVIGKFSYGLSDKDLKDEEVDVFVERGCGGGWAKLGTARTTKDGEHPEVEGVPDTGGRVYFQIPTSKKLPPGRHRVRLVVAGDHSSTDLVLDVVPRTTQLVVSDVDGTLTSSEHAEWPALLTGSMPAAHANAAAVLTTLASRGYRPVYLTARPEWLTGRTREFLALHKFPPGIVHTTTGLTGALGGSAAEFKSRELALLTGKGFKIAWAFGNKESDTQAYAAAAIEPRDHRVFLKIDDAHGGRRIEGYGDLLPAVNAAPRACNAP